MLSVHHRGARKFLERLESCSAVAAAPSGRFWIVSDMVQGALHVVRMGVDGRQELVGEPVQTVMRPASLAMAPVPFGP